MNTKVILFPLTEAALLPGDVCREKFPARYARAQRFLRQEDRLRCIGAGALLYGVLGLEEQEIQTGEHGKPFVADGRIQFSLSHSGKYILLAWDKTELGADIEEINPIHLNVANHVFLSEECAWMEQNPARRFFTLWTLKESVMKQCGLGFHLAPKTFSVLPMLHGEGIEVAGKTLYGASTEIENHCLSLCREQPIETVSPELVKATDLFR